MVKNKLQVLIINLFICTGLFFFTGLSVFAESSDNNDEWQFGGDVYLWGAEIKADTTAGPKIDIPFHDIISDLDMAVMGSLWARKDKLKLYADIIYLDIDDSEKGSFSIPIGPRGRELIEVGDKINWELKAWIVQPMAAYRVYETPKYSIDFTAGARYLWIEVDLELRTTGPFANRKVKTSDSGHNWDGIVGIKVDYEFNDKWGVGVYFDGGSGDSDYTWQGVAGLNYKFDSFTGVFGYRHLKWDFNSGPLEDLKISGPYAGARFTF